MEEFNENLERNDGGEVAERIPGREAYEWARSLVAAVLIITLVFTFAVRMMGVSGPSMIPTLQDGDRLIVINAALCGGYRAGEIVIARKESFDEKPIVKRVIATEGQTVDIDFDLGRVYVTACCWRRSISTTSPIWRRGRSFRSLCRRARCSSWATTATIPATAATNVLVLWTSGSSSARRCFSFSREKII